MISVYNIKPKFQALLKPIMEGLHRMGFKPNHITMIALIGSIAVGAFTFLNKSWIPLIVVPAFLLFRMALNAIDGMMARAYRQQSAIGEVLNEVGDVLADVSIFYPLLLRFGMEKHPHFVVAFIVLIILNEFVGVLGKAMGGERRYEGPMGKSDRALIFGVLCLIILMFPTWVKWSIYGFVLIFAAMLMSTLLRILNSIKA
jgi:CDP-diacylglycerol--glycerol-3-phosphate 3-phosphatidyltransferase